MTRNQRWNWLLLQMAAIAAGVYAGVRLLFFWIST
jgi:hypothetical protein